MKKIQYGKELVLADESGINSKILKYSLTESPVGFGYSELKSYGVEIECTEKRAGMQSIKECKLIEGIFFDIEEAIAFLGLLKKNRIMPAELAITLEKYIRERIKKQREQSEVGVGQKI